MNRNFLERELETCISIANSRHVPIEHVIALYAAIQGAGISVDIVESFLSMSSSLSTLSHAVQQSIPRKGKSA